MMKAMAYSKSTRKLSLKRCSHVKVHHVSPQGKPAGVARAKVFEMAAGDPLIVRKSGDDMTGAYTSATQTLQVCDLCTTR